MPELTFEEIELKNFLSFGNQPTKLTFNRKMNFVTGWNHQQNSSNGCGKTALLYNAILFGLFGDSFRANIKQNNLINYLNRKNMYVALTLAKGSERVYIYRSRSPNELYYTINGGEPIKHDSMSATQDSLNKYLEISEDIFTNIFFVNASEQIDFLKDSGSVKLKERFEKIFFKDVIFKKVLETARKEQNQVTKNLDLNNEKLKEKIGFLKRLKELMDEAKKKEDFEKEIESNKKKIEILQEKLQTTRHQEEIQTSEEKKKKIAQKKEEIIRKISSYQTETRHLKEKVRELDTKILLIEGAESKCPLCSASLNADKITELRQHFQEEGNKNKDDIRKIEKAGKELETTISKLRTFEDKLTLNITKLRQDEGDIKGQITTISNDIKRFEESYNNYMKVRGEAVNLKTDLLKLRKESEELNMTEMDLSMIISLFDNSGGLLKFFIEKVLVTLNQIILKYITKMGIDFVFYFNNDLKLCFNIYDNLELSNFSSGEKKIINFVILFSLMEFFYNSGFKPSILVIDEIADSTVSSSKMEIVYALLKEFQAANQIGMYFLSHDYRGKNNNVINFDSIIELEKKDGFTSIREISKP